MRNKKNSSVQNVNRYLACAKTDFKPKEEKPIFRPRNVAIPKNFWNNNTGKKR